MGMAFLHYASMPSTFFILFRYFAPLELAFKSHTKKKGRAFYPYVIVIHLQRPEELPLFHPCDRLWVSFKYAKFQPVFVAPVKESRLFGAKFLNLTRCSLDIRDIWLWLE